MGQVRQLFELNVSFDDWIGWRGWRREWNRRRLRANEK